MDDFARGRNATALPAGVAVFDWTTKIADLLPGDWELADEWATAKLNVRDVLTHVSGLTRWNCLSLCFVQGRLTRWIDTSSRMQEMTRPSR